MRIASFRAKGFRSLRDVPLDHLGAINVFYGPNGSGKSNILAAIDAWLRLVQIALDPDIEPLSPTDAYGWRARGKLALSGVDAPIHVQDFTVGSNSRKMSLEGTLMDVSPEIPSARIAVRLDGTVSRPILELDELEIDGLAHDIAGPQSSPEQDCRLQVLQRIDLAHEFSLVAADWMPRTAQAEQPPAGKEPLSWYFRRGHLKDALFAAQNAPSPDTVQALDCFRQLMSGPPLHRPPFRAVEDLDTRLRDLREQLPAPRSGQDISPRSRRTRHRADLSDPRASHAVRGPHGRDRGARGSPARAHERP